MPSDRVPQGPGNAPAADESAAREVTPGAGLDDVERALLAQLHFAAGEWQHGLAVLGEPQKSARGLSLLAARGRFAVGERDVALSGVAELIAERPHDALALHYQAQLFAQSGRPVDATAALRRVVEHMPNFPGALQALASLAFPGPPYRELLKRVHATLRPRTYLEIGVEHGTTLALAVHSQQVVGVDPVPRPPARELPHNTRLFCATSDEFFARHSRQDVFGELPLELAFIDGMHWFEYALRDFCNVERWCTAASTVILHDCLPVMAVAAERERQTTFWVGDTWKALECLLRERPDLRISIVPCHPSGLVVIQGLDARATLSSERLETLYSEYRFLTYPYEPGALPPHYPVVPNTEPQLSELLADLAHGAPRGRG